MDVARLAGIDLNLLVVLYVLLRERSVTRAAISLGLSQPAVSNALSRLRQALGDRLLVPAAGGMTPTPRALALEIPLREALERVGSAVAGSVAFDPATARRTFVLVASDYVELVLLGPLARRIEREAPSIDLKVLPTTIFASTAKLDPGSADLTLIGVGTAQAGLHRRMLFRDRLVCVLRAGHRWSSAPLTLARYLELSHVEVSPRGNHGLADQVLARQGRARRIAVTVPHFLVAPYIVLDTDACFTLAERIATPMAARLPLRVLPLPFEMPTITVWEYWPRRLHSDPGHRWLRRLVADVAASLGPESQPAAAR